uniref:SJCHGC03159 protein n=1 Tax=Schistosoma japonicum TaxID=6182 RepID=Q5BSV6_SCHJA|nr:SJCHGC03159 protein [Schistosoma japonicum]
MVFKILVSIIIRRITTIHDIQIRKNQAGFRSDRGCIDQIFTIRQVLKHRHTF